MRRAVEIVLAILGCEVLALVIALILAGIGESGVVALQITHYLFLLAFITSVVAAPLAAYVGFHSIKWAGMALLATILIVGGGLWWLNQTLVRMKAAQDIVNHLPAFPQSLYFAVPPPPVPIAKAPTSWLEQPKPAQNNGNGNITGNTMKGNNNKISADKINCSAGICATGDINGSPTVNNYVPPQRHLSEEQKSCLGKVADSLPADMPNKLGFYIGPDVDAQIYGAEIGGILLSRSKNYKYLFMLMPCTPGIWVEIYGGKDDDNGKKNPVLPEATTFVNSLAACQVTVNGFFGKENVPRNAIDLMVCAPPKN